MQRDLDRLERGDCVNLNKCKVLPLGQFNHKEQTQPGEDWEEQP